MAQASCPLRLYGDSPERREAAACYAFLILIMTGGVVTSAVIA